MSNTLDESFIRKTQANSQLETKSLNNKPSINGLKVDESLDELQKAWQFIRVEPLLNLPHSFARTLNCHKS